MWTGLIWPLMVILVAHLSSTSAFAYPTAKITLNVVDEHGDPVADAKVSVSFLVDKVTGWGTEQRDKNGSTDKYGMFVAESESSPMLGFSVDKEGYYQSGAGYKFTSKSLLNRWEPWNPTIEVVLKKKRNPVPMYMKGTDWIEVPAEDTPVGYDLEKGDWAAPYGTGITNDFVFIFTGDIRAFREYDLKMILKFSNELDGIQEYTFKSNEQSYFKWPYEAPDNSYQKELLKKIHKIPGKTETNINRNANYIFRVRTQTDTSGDIISARYGKVAGEFEMSPDGSKFLIRFFYYFNPDGTRNLEEDPKKNLFKKK